jgi:hypothetical protein
MIMDNLRSWKVPVNQFDHTQFQQQRNDDRNIVNSLVDRLDIGGHSVSIFQFSKSRKFRANRQCCVKMSTILDQLFGLVLAARLIMPQKSYSPLQLNQLPVEHQSPDDSKIRNRQVIPNCTIYLYCNYFDRVVVIELDYPHTTNSRNIVAAR